METYLLVGIVIVVLFFIIYSSLKTKKIYDEDLDYEPKNEELSKKIDKFLKLRGYRFITIKKYRYNYKIDKIEEKFLLPRVKIYKKRMKRFGLILNIESNKLNENLNLKKVILEFSICSKLNGIIVFNEKNSSMEIVEFHRERCFKRLCFILILIIIFLVVARIMNY